MADGAIYDSPLRKILNRVVKIDTTDFEVPSSVEEIKGGSYYESAFNPCANNIRRVNFSEGSQLIKVGALLFSETSLQSIDMSRCLLLTQLTEGLFFKCHNLVEVKLPINLENIPCGTFSQCTALPSLIVPDSVKEIGMWKSGYQGVFFNTRNLTSVTFTEHSQLSSLGSHAFQSSGFKHIYLPAALKTIFQAPFLDSCLETIEISSQNTKYKSDGHVITQGDGIVTIAPSYSGHYTISESATFGDQAFRGSHISSFTFEGNKNYILSAFCFSHIYTKTIQLPDLIEEISFACFFGSSLETIILPKNTKIIREQAFISCENLSSVILPEGLKQIEQIAFSNDSRLLTIEIPTTVEVYGDGVFSNCSNINIVFKNTERFKTNNYLVTLDNKKVVEYIGKDPEFEVTFPASYKVIGKHLFLGKSLKKVTFEDPSTVMKIGEAAFSESTIQEISFPTGLTSIDKNCFEGCKSLKKVVISGTLSTLPEYCFNKCKSLDDLTLTTDTITTIGNGAFNGTENLVSLDLSQLKLTTIGEIAFQASGLDKVSLPQTLESIGHSAFRETKVTEFSGESNIDNLPPYLLYGAEMLEHVEMSSNVTTIGIHCFEGCHRLKNVTLSPATALIDMYAFSMCTSLVYITIPENSHLETIRAFAFDGSTSFSSFNIKDTVKFAFDYKCLMDKDKTKIIYYIPVSPSKTFIVPATIKEINMYAFQYCKNLREIIIADGIVKTIGVNAFEGCSRLKRVFLPKSLTTIGADAFKDCTSLECGSININKELIDQARNAKIPEIALQDNCITLDDYIQFGKHTCVYRGYSKNIQTFLLLVQLMLL